MVPPRQATADEPAMGGGDHAPRAGGIAARAMAHQRDTSYLDGLNPEQRDAVETVDGPVLVLAGAGTGKTRVLTTRIAHTIGTGRARAHEILAVTFTNKAAREMKERVGMLAGPVAEGMPWLGTFHAISTKILRRHAELVGLKSGFTILDTDDQIRLLKQVIQAANIDDKRWPARALAHQIDAWKNKGLAPAQVPAGEAAAFANGRGGECYKHYQERLKVLNATDFGDLLLECVRLFREHGDVLRQYQDRFKYMLVDEYQDTNTVQYLWLRLLAGSTAMQDGRRQNVCCVGDDDQSIYGWRGAEVDNILRFETDFPGAKVIRLERNYRSTGHILGTAAHLIGHNEGRLGKTLFTDDVDGEKTTVTGIWDSEEEARTIGDEIERLQRDKHGLEEFAILVRASFQMREFEERFITLGLPYRVIGGPRFYERAEIRDALAYLRCVAQPQDDLAFERIFNQPKRGLGDATLQLLHEHARREAIPLMAAARVMVETEELKPKQRQTLRALVGRLRALGRALIDRRCRRAGWPSRSWKSRATPPCGCRDRTAEAAGRLDNLKELVRAMEEFADLGGLPGAHFARNGCRRWGWRGEGLDHDAPRCQRPRVRDRVPAGLGGGAVSPSAVVGRVRPCWARGGAALGLRRCHAGEAARQDLFRHQPPHSWPVANDGAFALPRRIAGAARERGGSGQRQCLRRLRPIPFRQHRPVRFPLRHAGLAARAEAAGGRWA